VVENATGSSCEQDIDYFPYGNVAHDYCPTVAQHYRFNGKERDTESGLDNFGARYDASNLARFMTPDWAAKPTNVPYASFGNPQSLNLYSYVNNNPTTVRDPNGHCIEDACVAEGLALAALTSYVASPAGQQLLHNAAASALNGAYSLGQWIGKSLVLTAAKPHLHHKAIRHQELRAGLILLGTKL
jgi:RHS repeat-associated protein